MCYPVFRENRSHYLVVSTEVNIAGVEAAKEQWALENNKTNGTSVVWSNISNYMGSGITSLSNLSVNGCAITINKIGTPASY
jgi:hypothetical protein